MVKAMPKKTKQTPDVYGTLRQPEFFSSGCLLFDKALSGGWCENRIINLIGDNCLSGDTVVSIKRGSKFKKLSLKNLDLRINGGQHNKNSSLQSYILANVGGTIAPIKLLDIRKTGKKEIYEIKDNDGHVIKASADHKFLTPKGWKTINSGLKVGSLVNIWKGFIKETKIAETSNSLLYRDYTYSIPLLTSEEHTKIHRNNLNETAKITSWATLVSIKVLGVENTYDITTESPNNFIANGFVVHNSTGKTLLAIVACKTYHDKYPKRKITYIEAEQAFNPDFARNLGFDFNAMEFCDTIVTVEGLFEKLTARIEDDPEGLVVVDSLDALSTEEELEGEFSAGYHGARKAERMSSLFRQLNARLSKANVTVLIVSQTRQKIGVVYGRKWTRAGGNALDFYASHRVILANIGKLVKTVSGIKRPIGIMTKAVVEKNKFGPSFREAEIPLLYDFGIDDDRANRAWLNKLKVPYGTVSDQAQIKIFAAEAWDNLEKKFKTAPVETENATDTATNELAAASE